ncbi:MAG: hypothetical protein R3E82_10430 [Pseudomonadales bacterium]|nr:hypothetical protein [Pseudomonadales bacterium]
MDGLDSGPDFRSKAPDRSAGAVWWPGLLGALFALAGVAVSAQEAAAPLTWLELPATWLRGQEADGVVSAVPGDLLAGTSFLLLVDPPRELPGDLNSDLAGAIADLGPWRAVGPESVRETSQGWDFSLSAGVATLNGVDYTALIALARRNERRVRFWAFADSDATYNRHQAVVMDAIASVPRLDAQHSARAPATATSEPLSNARTIDSGTRVFLGLDRGLSAGAGGNAIVDAEEVDVLFADGTYRRRLPVRGLVADMNWDRSQQPAMWGTWRARDDELIFTRGDYRQVVQRHSEGFTDDRGRYHRPVAMPAPLRLDGSYARLDYRDAAAPRLILHREGRYEDRGDFLRMVGAAWHLVVPDGEAMRSRWSDAEARRALGGGAGVYRFELFTLALDGDDGRRWRINALVPPGQHPEQPQQLIVNGRVLARD